MYAAQGAPQGRVTFGWIGEAWARFTAQAGTWVLATFIYGIITFAVIYAVEMAVMLPMMMRIMPAPGAAADPTSMARTMMPMMSLLYIVVGCAALLLNSFLGGGLLKMANKAVRNYPVELGDLFSGGSSFVALLLCQLPFYIVYLVYMLASFSFIFGHTPSAAFYPGSVAYWQMMERSVGTGLAFDIVPIVLLALFWPAASMAADGESAKEALGKSFNAMKGSWLMSALFMLVVAIIGFFSTLLTCSLGLLATIPMFAILSSLMYRDMVGMPTVDPPAIPGYYGQPPYPNAGNSGQPPASPGVWPPPPGAYQPQPPEQGNPPADGPT